MPDIAGNIARIEQQICAAASRYQRARDSIQLVAISKTKPDSLVRAAFATGLTHFGESYAQEGAAKIAALSDLPICWHFVGPIQSNKTKLIAQNFAWVHSVDRARIVDRLARQRPVELPPLNVLLQVNVSGEASKSGVAPGEVIPLAHHVLGFPRLALRGLMTVPAPATGIEAQRLPFARLRELLAEVRDALGPAGNEVDQLSMGMTDDLEAAIAEGATMVRIGTAIFGPREIR